VVFESAIDTSEARCADWCLFASTFMSLAQLVSFLRRLFLFAWSSRLGSMLSVRYDSDLAELIEDTLSEELRTACGALRNLPAVRAVSLAVSLCSQTVDSKAKKEKERHDWPH